MMRKHLLLIALAVVVIIGLILFFALKFYQPNPPKIAGTPTTSIQLTEEAVPHNEHEVVSAFDQDAIKQDWAELFALSSTLATGDYTESQFSQIMAAQVKTLGAITSITFVSGPVVKVSAEGIVYFLVEERVTRSHNGTAQAHSTISVYILENDVWKFWFSKVISS